MAVHGHYHLTLQGPKADRPATPGYDLLYIATDTNEYSYYNSVVGPAWSAWFTLTSLTVPVPISQGGTGQTAKQAAFDALSPLSTLGDLIKHDGTNNIRLGVGSEGAILRVISGTPAWARSPQAYPLFAANQVTTYSWIPGISWSSFGGTGQVNHHLHDFTYVREARLHVRGNLKSTSTGIVYVKVVDITNTQDLTPTVNFPQATKGNWLNKDSAWAAINSNTYTNGDAYFEAQAYTDGDATDLLYVGTIEVEFR